MGCATRLESSTLSDAMARVNFFSFIWFFIRLDLYCRLRTKYCKSHSSSGYKWLQNTALFIWTTINYFVLCIICLFVHSFCNFVLSHRVNLIAFFFSLKFKAFTIASSSSARWCCRASINTYQVLSFQPKPPLYLSKSDRLFFFFFSFLVCVIVLSAAAI